MNTFGPLTVTSGLNSVSSSETFLYEFHFPKTHVVCHRPVLLSVISAFTFTLEECLSAFSTDRDEHTHSSSVDFHNTETECVITDEHACINSVCVCVCDSLNMRSAKTEKLNTISLAFRIQQKENMIIMTSLI